MNSGFFFLVGRIKILVKHFKVFFGEREKEAKNKGKSGFIC